MRRRIPFPVMLSLLRPIPVVPQQRGGTAGTVLKQYRRFLPGENMLCQKQQPPRRLFRAPKPCHGAVRRAAQPLLQAGVEVYLPLAGLVDLEKEKERLEKELAGLAEEKSRLEQKLANTQFLAKAPEAVVAKEKQKLAAVEEKYAKVSARLAALKS